MKSDFDAVAYARDELEPILRSLCELAEAEEQPAQHAYFSRILHAIEQCTESPDLAGPFLELSAAAFNGLQYSAAVAMLLDVLLAKAQLLTESLALDEDEVH